MLKSDKKIKELLEDAYDLYRKNKNKEAIEKYEEILKIDKDNMEARFRYCILKTYETTYDDFNIEGVINILLEVAPKCSSDEELTKYVTEAFFAVVDLRDFAISLYDNNPFNKDDVDDFYNKLEKVIYAFKMIFNVAPVVEKNEISKMIIISYDYMLKKKYYYSGFNDKKVKLIYKNKNRSRYLKERKESVELLKENNINSYKELMMYYAINIREKYKFANYLLIGISLIIMCFSFIICRSQISLIFLVLLYLISIPFISVNLFKENIKLEIISKLLLFILSIITFIWFLVPSFAFNKDYYGSDNSNISLNVDTGVEIINKEKHTYKLNIRLLDDYYEFKLGNNIYRYRSKNNIYYLCRVKNDKCNIYFYDSNSVKKYVSNDLEFKKYFK